MRDLHIFSRLPTEANIPHSFPLNFIRMISPIMFYFKLQSLCFSPEVELNKKQRHLIIDCVDIREIEEACLLKGSNKVTHGVSFIRACSDESAYSSSIYKG